MPQQPSQIGDKRSASRTESIELLPQRKQLLEKVRQGFASSDEQLSCILLLDVRDFRELTHSFGEDCGDAILQAIYKRLINADPELFDIYYLGNDEFAALVTPIKSPGFAVLHAETLLALFREVFEWQDHTLKITVNCGIAYNYDKHTDAPKLLYDAELALKLAKTQNQPFQMLGKQDQQHGDQRKWELLSSLHEAIRDDELTLYYQPKVALRPSLHSEFDASAEALIRWQNKTHGMMSPAITLPLIEHLGSEIELIRWLLNTALKQLHEEEAHCGISLNVPASSVSTPELYEAVEEALQIWPVEPGQLTLEVTEDIFIRDKEMAFDWLSKIRALGVRIAIDDFGTGYSSLAYFKHIPADELKIDQAFIRNMLRNKEDCNIVKLIIELAHLFNLQVVAEGVEDEATLNLLKTLGCDYAQGFAISKPLPYESYLDWIQTR